MTSGAITFDEHVNGSPDKESSGDEIVSSDDGDNQNSSDGGGDSSDCESIDTADDDTMLNAKAGEVKQSIIGNMEGADSDLEAQLLNRFYGDNVRHVAHTANGAVIGLRNYETDYEAFDCGYFGRLCEPPDDRAAFDEHFYLNVSQPFCLVCVGVQGAGKLLVKFCYLC